MDNKAAHITKLRGLFHQMNGEERFRKWRNAAEKGLRSSFPDALISPLKTNMAPENHILEKEIPIGYHY